MMKIIEVAFIIFISGCAYSAFAQEKRVYVDMKMSRQQNLKNLEREYAYYQNKLDNLKSVVDNLNAVVSSER